MIDPRRLKQPWISKPHLEKQHRWQTSSRRLYLQDIYIEQV